MRHTKTSYKLISLALCLTMLLPLAGCGESKQAQAEIFAMDTYMTLTAYGKNAEAGLAAVPASGDAGGDGEPDGERER